MYIKEESVSSYLEPNTINSNEYIDSPSVLRKRITELEKMVADGEQPAYLLEIVKQQAKWNVSRDNKEAYKKKTK